MKKSQNDIVTYTRTIGYVHHIVENGKQQTTLLYRVTALE